MTILDLFHESFTTFPGLADAPASWRTDANIRARFAAIRRGLERDVSAEVAELFRSSGRERALCRRALWVMVPQLREARRVSNAAFSLMCKEHAARRAVAAAAAE